MKICHIFLLAPSMFILLHNSRKIRIPLSSKKYCTSFHTTLEGNPSNNKKRYYQDTSKKKRSNILHIQSTSTLIDGSSWTQFGLQHTVKRPWIWQGKRRKQHWWNNGRPKKKRSSSPRNTVLETLGFTCRELWTWLWHALLPADFMKLKC